MVADTQKSDRGKQPAKDEFESFGGDEHRITRAMEDGETAMGYYLGSTEVVGKFGPREIHFFQDDTGRFSLYGASVLDRLLKGATLGRETMIKRVGRIPEYDATQFTMKQRGNPRSDLAFVGLSDS